MPGVKLRSSGSPLDVHRLGVGKPDLGWAGPEGGAA